ALREALGSFHGRMLRLSRWATEETSEEVLRLPFSGATAYGGQLRKLVSESVERTHRGDRVVIVSQQAQRLAELFVEEDAPAAVSTSVRSAPAHLTLLQGSLSEGWRLADGGVELTLI